ITDTVLRAPARVSVQERSGRSRARVGDLDHEQHGLHPPAEPVRRHALSRRARPADDVRVIAAPMRHSLIAIAAGAVLAGILTYPTIVRPGSVARVDTDDGKFSVWNVAWVAHALLTDPRHVFDANIFYPHTGTLAYSEANLVAGALAAPVYAVTGNPLAAHNVVVFVVLVLAFVAMWALVRHLTGSWTAALVAATAFAFPPHVAAKTAHIQLLMVWVFPAVMLAFHRFAESPGLGRGVVLGLSLAAA